MMAEIGNVRRQLGEIVSEMGVPLSSGGPAADYLTAVATGLIQFVCVHTGRGSFRSLTAERILIHPGSVMFRESPRFIVAGEIVRTSRTYARSVSPLREAWLKRLSPLLAESLLGEEEQALAAAGRGGDGRGRGKRRVPQRDTTWQIRIGTHMFPLKATKGKKKNAIIDWDQLRSALKENPVVLPQFHSLKGKLVYQDLELVSSARVADIMKIARHIDPRRDLVSKWPRELSFDSSSDAADLARHLALVLKICRTKKQTRRVGFIALQTDGYRRYWFKPVRDYYQAVAESLGAMEQLADELADDAGDEAHAALNETYRRLASILEE
jgi:hypothetical protein